MKRKSFLLYIIINFFSMNLAAQGLQSQRDSVVSELQITRKNQKQFTLTAKNNRLQIDEIANVNLIIDKYNNMATQNSCINKVKNKFGVNNSIFKNLNYLRSSGVCYAIITNPYLRADDLSTKFGSQLNFDQEGENIQAAFNMTEEEKNFQKSLYHLIPKDECKNMCGVWVGNKCEAHDNAERYVSILCSNYF